MAKLLLIENGKAQHVQMGQELTIGRAYSNLLRLEGEEISRVHAIVYRRGEDYILRDLDSKNGVLLNGQKVANALLGKGDEIQIGPHLLVFDPPPSFDLGGFIQDHGAPQDGELHSTQSNEMESSMVFARSAETPLSNHSVPGPAVASGKTLFLDPEELQEILNDELGSESSVAGKCMLRIMQLLQQHSLVAIADLSAIQALLQATVEALGADRGVVAVRAGGDGALNLSGIVPLEQDVAVNRVVMRAVLKEGQAVFCNDAQGDPLFGVTETVRKDEIGSLLSCPIWRGQEILGFVYLDALREKDVFRKEHLVVVNLVSQIAALTSISPKVAGGPF